MKSSILSPAVAKAMAGRRIILTICLATFTSTHAASAGPTLTNEQRINMLKYGSVGIASLVASQGACKLILLEAGLGAAVYTATAHYGNKDLAKLYAGRVGFIALIALGMKLIEKPTKVIVPPLLLWLLSDEYEPESFIAVLKKSAKGFTEFAGAAMTMQNRKSLAAGIKNLFGISAHAALGIETQDA